MSERNGSAIIGHIAQLMAMIVTVIGATLWLQNQLHLIDSRIQRLELVSVVDRWTGTDMVLWASDLRLKNDGLNVPRPVHRIPERPTK